jgi:hypothetical protein
MSDLKFEESIPVIKTKGNKHEKEKINKWMAENEDDLSEINFIKMKDNELIQKIPTLKRYDHT